LLNFKKLLVVLVLSLSMIACSNDDDSPIGGHLNASYEFKIGDEVISSNSSIPLGIVRYTNSKIQISVTERDNEFMMMMIDIPRTIGEQKTLNSEEDITVSLVGSKVANYQENFGEAVVIEGTMTRVADDKVSFTGTFEHNGLMYNATGFIKSDGIKNN